MNNNDFVTVQSFDHRLQADMLLLLLHQRDIPARLADEHVVAMEWALANAIGGIKVQVPVAYEPAALEIVLELKANAKSDANKSGEEYDDDSCLSCGTSMPENHSVCKQCGWSYDE